MKFYDYDQNKGHGYEDERAGRLLNTNSPDEPANTAEFKTTPGTGDDIWKRYIESRLRSFGMRGN